MDYLERFKNYLVDNELVVLSNVVLLAVSGGRDSMVMTELFVRAGHKVILAHCNFSLRGTESDLDEDLVRQYAVRHHLPIFTKTFDTLRIAKENKISIQMAARDLRYQWFEELRAETNASFIAIAQHANDQIETVLLNLTRGTGLKGLCGILPKRESIIRPILHFSAAEIQEIAHQWNIPYRDDASNFDTKYSRNKVRLKIIPLFKEINPEFEETFIQNIQHFNNAYTLLQQFVQPLKDDLFKEAPDGLIKIEREKLQIYLPNPPLLYELFSDFQFSAAVIQDFCASWNNGSGRVFESPTHQLLFDRTYIWLRKVEQNPVENVFICETDSHVDFYNWKIDLTIGEKKEIIVDERIAQLDYDKLSFPLSLRNWKYGDKFVPLGMRSSKKISDYLIGVKLSLFEKERACVLVNGNNEIVWLLNHRIDNRYKITENTRKVLTLVCRN